MLNSFICTSFRWHRTISVSLQCISDCFSAMRLFKESCLHYLDGMVLLRLYFYTSCFVFCFILFSWYLVSGMHYGWTVDWKNIVPWHRPYPLEVISLLKWKLDLHFHVVDKKISSGFSLDFCLFVFKWMASFTIQRGEFLILLRICSSLLSVVITRFAYCLFLLFSFKFI